MDYKTLNFEQIVNWCKENKQTAWLKDYADANPGFSFLSLKKAFAAKFMPNIIPNAKAKKPSMLDIIASL